MENGSHIGDKFGRAGRGGVQNREQDKPLEPAAPGNQHGNTGEQEEVVQS